MITFHLEKKKKWSLFIWIFGAGRQVLLGFVVCQEAGEQASLRLVCCPGWLVFTHLHLLPRSAHPVTVRMNWSQGSLLHRTALKKSVLSFARWHGYKVHRTLLVTTYRPVFNLLVFNLLVLICLQAWFFTSFLDNFVPCLQFSCDPVVLERQGVKIYSWSQSGI